jgi:hypothetical protein
MEASLGSILNGRGTNGEQDASAPGVPMSLDSVPETARLSEIQTDGA